MMIDERDVRTAVNTIIQYCSDRSRLHLGCSRCAIHFTCNRIRKDNAMPAGLEQLDIFHKEPVNPYVYDVNINYSSK